MVMKIDNKNNIVLIGMPGCGKSSAGVVLAKVLGYGFIDSDLMIQMREGRLLSELLRQEGLEGFLSIEDEVNAGLDVQNAVIATGGSVIYGKRAMEHLKEIGTVVYLDLPLSEIKNRLGDLAERGVAMKDGQTLDSLYLERVPLYEKYADIKVDVLGLDIRKTIEKIKEKTLNEGCVEQ